MTDDMVERLRGAADVSDLPSRYDWCVGVLPSFLEEAADEIERLRGHVAGLHSLVVSLQNERAELEIEVDRLRALVYEQGDMLSSQMPGLDFFVKTDRSPGELIADMTRHLREDRP